MKQKTHTVTIKVRFDAALTAKEARYAVWNVFQDYQMYGDGKQTKRDEEAWGRNSEPYDEAKVTVKR